jgi:signal transduction histidine kinase
MEQALVNIVKNAIEAAGEGGRITIRLAVEDGRPRLTVEDSGPGIPDDVREHLFTPFFTSKPDGQGIGLTMVQEILANHRLEFSLDGPAGGPTRFTIVFPGEGTGVTPARPYWLDETDGTLAAFKRGLEGMGLIPTPAG